MVLFTREISVQYVRKMSKLLTKKTMIGLLERHSCRVTLRSCVIHTEGLKGIVRRKLIGVLLDIKRKIFVSYLDADILFKFKETPSFKFNKFGVSV
jgi:hypothetical protein